MTTRQDLDRLFPSMNQIGGEHYKLKIQPYTFIMENNLNLCAVFGISIFYGLLKRKM